MSNCGDCSEQFPTGWVEAGPSEANHNMGSAYEYPAGRYFVVVEPIDIDIAVSFSIRAPTE